MKVKFNKYERIAGLFVMIALIGSVSAGVGIAIEKGWFSPKVQFHTVIKSADGINKGTAVQISGLRAGSVEEIELISSEEVRVTIEVLSKFRNRIKEDSKVQVIRPFVIGEKVIDISIGSDLSPLLGANSNIPAIDSYDVMDIFSGKKLGPLLSTMEGMMTNIKMLADAFADEKRTEAFIKMFDQLTPLLRNMNTMSKQVVKVTDVAMEKQRLQKMFDNVVLLTDAFEKLTPAIVEVAPEMPQASRRALEALDETVITLKAIQKSFILSGKVEDVREEEAKKRKMRKPASE